MPSRIVASRKSLKAVILTPAQKINLAERSRLGKLFISMRFAANGWKKNSVFIRFFEKLLSTNFLAPKHEPVLL